MTILFAAIWAENKFTRLPKRPHCVANKIMLLSIELIGAALMARLRHATTRYYEGILQSTSSRIRTIECMFYASDHFAKNLTEDLVINTYSTFKIFKISFFFFLILRSSLANDCTSTMCGRHNESSYFKKQKIPIQKHLTKEGLIVYLLVINAYQSIIYIFTFPAPVASCVMARLRHAPS